MGSKSWIVILGLGVAAVVAMGLMTTYLVDNRPDLKAAIEFKAALAEAFRGEGFEEVSLRRLPKSRGYQLHLVRAPGTSAGQAEALDRRLAEFFIEKFDAPWTGVLQLTYSTPQGFGCSRSEPYRETDISLRELRQQLADERRTEEVRKRLERLETIELTRMEREAAELTLDVRLSPRGDVPVATDEDALTGLATEVRRTVDEVLRYRKLHVRIAAASAAERDATTAGAAPEAWLLEVSFDSRGRLLPR